MNTLNLSDNERNQFSTGRIAAAHGAYGELNRTGQVMCVFAAVMEYHGEKPGTSGRSGGYVIFHLVKISMQIFMTSKCIQLHLRKSEAVK